MLRVLGVQGRPMYLTAPNGFHFLLAYAPVHGQAPPPVGPPPTADLACLVHDCDQKLLMPVTPLKCIVL